ncbi:MAG: alpha/beta hydrolase [Proteobacteria bacterium]|nr:alpha/beta hydrolase [Pseudomonadota bacterium]MBU1686863.1 alpha/beta hydrolase [Pseudomonadota bacterium]
MDLPVQFTEVDGNRIAFYRTGGGAPLVLVHGITTYSFIWRRLLPGLKKNFDVIAIDLLGCGASDKPVGKDYSIKAQSRIIKQALDNLGIDSFHLVTHDIGGGIGQIMAVDYPERVRDLVLINTVAYDYWPVQPIITMRVPFIRQLAMASLDFGIFKTIVKRGIYHKERVTDELMELFWQPLRTKEGRQGFLQLAKCINNQLLLDIADRLKDLTIPVMIVRGDADPYLTPEICEKLHREIPGSRLERIATGAHFIQEDEPERLVALINDFTGVG